MPNPTRQEILDVYDALGELQLLAGDSQPGDPDTIRTLGGRIVAHLPRIPRPTMAEVEWDDDKHYLAEAEHPDYGKVIMLGPDHDGLIEFFVPKFHKSRYDTEPPYTLTPTGKRYTLTEVQE